MGYFCPVCKMEVININNHIDCPGPNRDSGPFPGKVMGGRGICSKCGEVVNNVAYHESICGKNLVTCEPKMCGSFNAYEGDKREQDNCATWLSNDMACPIDKKIVRNKMKELEAENKKLREALRIANEDLSSCNRRLNRVMDDSFNDIMADRDDYR